MTKELFFRLQSALKRNDPLCTRYSNAASEEMNGEITRTCVVMVWILQKEQSNFLGGISACVCSEQVKRQQCIPEWNYVSNEEKRAFWNCKWVCQKWTNKVWRHVGACVSNIYCWMITPLNQLIGHLFFHHGWQRSYTWSDILCYQ